MPRPRKKSADLPRVSLKAALEAFCNNVETEPPPRIISSTEARRLGILPSKQNRAARRAAAERNR